MIYPGPCLSLPVRSAAAPGSAFIPALRFAGFFIQLRARAGRVAALDVFQPPVIVVFIGAVAGGRVASIQWQARHLLRKKPYPAFGLRHRTGALTASYGCVAIVISAGRGGFGLRIQFLCRCAFPGPWRSPGRPFFQQYHRDKHHHCQYKDEFHGAPRRAVAVLMSLATDCTRNTITPPPPCISQSPGTRRTGGGRRTRCPPG